MHLQSISLRVVMIRADRASQVPIESNPDAMSAIDQLKQMGYTADDVAQAMQDDQSSASGCNAPGGSKAPLQIPGM